MVNPKQIFKKRKKNDMLSRALLQINHTDCPGSSFSGKSNNRLHSSLKIILSKSLHITAIRMDSIAQYTQ